MKMIANSKKYFFLKSKKKLSEKENDYLKYILENHISGNLIMPKIYYKNGEMKKVKEFIIKKNNFYWYCFPIVRNINDEEINEINNKLKLVFNFEFYLPKKFKKENKFEEFIEMISKIVYNKLLNDKIERGWKYGLVYDKINKISPKIVYWDNLKNKQKIRFKEKIKKIYEILKFYL